LSDFARTMVTDFPIQGILEHLVLRIVEMMPITAAGVTLISPTLRPRYVAASDDSALRYEQLQTELGEGPCVAAYQSGEAVSVPDLRSGDDFTRFRPRALKEGLGAVFTFPLRQGSKQLGALDLYRDTPGPLSDDEMIDAQTLADVTAAYLVNAQARTDLQDASDRARERSVHDDLTGLPNRILLLERMEHAFLRSRRSHMRSAVFFIDLDRFKDVNDTYGHQTGDALLVAVAERISRLLRPGDTLARLSGDEFVILSEELDDQTHAEAIALRVVEALEEPFELPGAVVEISGSIGIAIAGTDQNDPEQLLRDADIAMYQVKHKGGARSQVIDLRQRHVEENRAALQRDLHHAVDRGELRLDYQPIVRAGTGMIAGVEALLRWDHPTRGPVPPTMLIPLAEQTGDIIEIGRWALSRACADWKRWSHAGSHDSLAMAVNVSAHQLMASGFAAIVEEVLADTDTSAGLLTLELTESALLRDPERALVILTDLKGLGLNVALDDFGTGYSSLSYLRQFPVDIIKLDQSFIVDLGFDRASRSIVMKIIELAHLLGMTVVSEGVETEERRQEVTTLGTDFWQGYYFERPMSAESLDRLVMSGRNG